MNNNQLYDRYQRQIILKGFGVTAQQKLLDAKVLIIGAGGLGCPALQYLTAAGVGTIGIADDDVVSLSNLHRQVLYTTADIGLPKVERAAWYLQQLNPEIKIIQHHTKLISKNALDIIATYDIIVDGTDNFAARYLTNDACVLMDKPLVYGAVSQYEGQVAVFNTGDTRINYRDLFPNPPANDEIPNCEEAGVLGALPAIIGAMQAGEVIKLVTGIGQPLINRLLTFNILTSEMYEVVLSARKETVTLIPADQLAFENTDYEWLCTVKPADVVEIDSNGFSKLIATGNATVIDVREPNETPDMDEVECLKIPMTSLMERLPPINDDTIIVFCQSGKRSLKAAGWLAGIFGASKNIYSLQGGILAWKQHQHKST